MHFSTLTAILFAVASGVMAAPAPNAGAPEASHLQARTCGTLSGKPLQVCQGVCKAACSAIPASFAQKACKKSCMLGPLKARDLEAEAEFDIDFTPFGQLQDEPVDGADGLQAREPITGGQVCRGACAVTCNSTVLALRQKWCLEKCNAKCPSN